MFAKCSTFLLVFALLVGIAADCRADEKLIGPIRIDASKGVCAISVGKIRGTAEHVTFNVDKDGSLAIQLSGNAAIEMSDCRMSAQKIELAENTDGELALRLEGSARIETGEVLAASERVEIRVPVAIHDAWHLRWGVGPVEIRSIALDFSWSLDLLSTASGIHCRKQRVGPGVHHAGDASPADPARE